MQHKAHLKAAYNRRKGPSMWAAHKNVSYAKKDLIRFKKEKKWERSCTDSITNACTDAERKMYLRVKLNQIWPLGSLIQVTVSFISSTVGLRL